MVFDVGVHMVGTPTPAMIPIMGKFTLPMGLWLLVATCPACRSSVCQAVVVGFYSYLTG